MIKSKKDYLFYLEADRLSLGVTNNIKQLLFNDVWKFQCLLRKLEYLTNCKKNILYKKWIAYKFRNLSYKLGFTIPINVFGPGLSIAHYGTIIVNSKCKIGKNCRIHACVNIGSEAGKAYAAPKIGDNCYIAPGAKIYGPITIGDNTAIGANSVVNNNFIDGNVTIGGIPAKIISKKNTDGIITKGTELIKETI